MNPLLRLFNLKGGAEDGDSLTEWAGDEIERLRAANRDLQDWLDNARATAEKAEARATKLSEALQVAQQESVPDGWKLVPVEPTTEMRYAYHEADQRYLEGSIPSPDGQWWAMLDAAPQPPKEDRDDE